MSHRCDVAVEGTYVTGVAVALRHGSFIQIEVYPCSPAISDDEAEHPQPLPGFSTPSVSTPTSSYSTAEFASTSDTSGPADPDEYTRVIHLFRPAVPGRPTHIHALTPPGTRSWRTSVFEAWPQLRYDPWQVADVHQSFVADYPQQDDVTYRVIIAPPDLPTPEHKVPLAVLHWREFTFFRAITLPRFATTGHVLAAFGLVSWCGVDQEHCPVYHNGFPWSTTSRQAIEHGDYIRIAPRLLPTPGFDSHLARVFNQDDELHRWQNIDLMGTARLRGDSTQAASTIPGPCPIPRVHSRGDWYWISMAWLMSFATCLLLKHLYLPAKSLPPGALKIVSRRHRLPRFHHREGLRWTPVFLQALLMSQHAIGCTGLQWISHDARSTSSNSPLLVQLPQGWHTSGYEATFSGLRSFRGPCEGLPPPGNPWETSGDLRSLLTPHGRLLLTFLDFRCSIYLACCGATSAPGLAESAPVETSKCLRNPPLNRLVPTPVRANKPPQEAKVISLFDSIVAPAMTESAPEVSCPIHCTDQDLNDLIECWTSPPIPPFQVDDDTPDILREILCRPFGNIAQATQLAIYTDGSRGDVAPDDHTAATTWAFVVLGLCEDTWSVIDWYGDFLELDPLASSWTGAVNDTVLEGELCALQSAYLWILQMESNVDAPVFSDSMLALHMSTGRYSYRLDDDMALRTRAVHQFLQVCMYRTGRHSVSHVRAHRGTIGNEIADMLANRIRTKLLKSRPLPRHYAEWFHGNPAKILRAGLVMDTNIRPAELPELRDDCLTFSPAERLGQPPTWLPSVSQAEALPAAAATHLTIATFNVHTLRSKGAAVYLREQLTAKRVFMIGLQETRNTFVEVFDTSYLRFGAPAECGNGGTELWVSRQLPYTVVNKNPCYINRGDVQVLVADPEVLIAEVNLGNRPILCCVAHAPHKGHTAIEISSWWQHLRQRLQSVRRQRILLVYIDANASVGEAPPHFGTVDEQEWDVAGQELLCLCRTFDLLAPSTHSQWHSGTSQTWTSAKSSALGSRNDYILVDSRWQHYCNASWVDNFLDAGHRMVDHSAALLSLSLQEDLKAKPHKECGWDRQKILTATPEVWQEFYAEWPSIPWEADVTEHARQVEEFLQKRLVDFFPKDRQKQRNSVFCDSTWELHRSKVRAKSALTQCKKTHELWQLAYGWASLVGKSPHAARVHCLLNALRTSHRLRLYQRSCRLLHEHILQDRATMAEQLLDPLHRCPGKKAVQLLKPLRLGKRHSSMGRKSLPMVRHEDGSVVQSRAEAVHRWRRHFSQIEGGITTDPDRLWHDYEASRAAQGDSNLDAADIPTVFELEHHLRRSALGKSCGIDSIPGELLHASSSAMAHHLWPLLLKMTVRVQEPLQYKGGKLISLFKGKGSPLECSSYRAILVSSPLGKCLHNVFRSRIVPYLQDAATPLQYSAQKGGMVAMAAHTIRLAQGRAKSGGLSDFTFFVDIASAYYTLLRQLSVDLSCGDEDVCLFLRRMGVEDVHISEVARLFSETPAINDLDAPTHLRSMIAEFHSSTWFAIPSDSCLTATSRGTRPGDGFADILWNLTFNRFLRSVEAQLQASGALQPAWWNGEQGLLTDRGPLEVVGACVCWADDLACFGCTQNAQDIIPSASTVSQIILEELATLGLAPNMGRGKTEMIITPRGPGRTLTRQMIHHANKGHVNVYPDRQDLVQIRVVPHYPHLGGQISHCGKMRGEVKRRLAIAMKSMKDLAPKIYHNRKVDLPTRLAIFKATTWPALLYNAGTWLSLSPFEAKSWHTGVMRLYRRLLSKLHSFDEIFKSPDSWILQRTGLPPPDLALRLCRLRYFGQALGRGNEVLWALAAEEGSWISTVRSDFDWLYGQISGLTSMPCPRQEPEAWHSLILNAFPRWKGLLRKAEKHAIGQWTVHQEANTFHRQLVDIFRPWGLIGPPADAAPPSAPTSTHRCLPCQRTFASRRAWGSHCFKVHGRVNPCRSLCGGTVCEACGKRYPSHERLVRHLRTVPSCRSTLAGQRLWTQPQPYYGNRAVQDRAPTDAMIPWQPTTTPLLTPRQALALTSAAYQALRWMSITDWTSADQQVINGVCGQLRSIPLHWDELSFLVSALETYHADDDGAIVAIHQLRDRMHHEFFPAQASAATASLSDNWPDHIEALDFEQVRQAPRKQPRFYYVVHLFSGVKREQDIHSLVATMPTPPSGILCPISLDVMLSPTDCDLLRPSVQSFWISKARDGYIHLFIMGPPCETWSISRLRHIITGSGPRPVRACNEQWQLWAKPVLRLQELLQVQVGNSLLQLCMLLTAAQAVTGRFSILEHPMCSEPRHGIDPPSIWKLSAMQLILRHPNTFSFDIRQGSYGGRSPKPTTLLFAARPGLRSVIESVLDQGRTNLVQPPAVQMGRASDHSGYNTAPLKRYPPGLCKTIAKLSFISAEHDEGTDSSAEDGLHDLASQLEGLYQTVCEGSVDGADFCGGAYPT